MSSDIQKQLNRAYDLERENKELKAKIEQLEKRLASIRDHLREVKNVLVAIKETEK